MEYYTPEGWLEPMDIDDLCDTVGDILESAGSFIGVYAEELVDWFQGDDGDEYQHYD